MTNLRRRRRRMLFVLVVLFISGNCVATNDCISKENGDGECTVDERQRQLLEQVKDYLPQDPKTHPVDGYNIHDCPLHPPDGYPHHWDASDILRDWKVTDALPPNAGIYQGICVFDYVRDYDKAMSYRRHDVPFVVRNRPEILETVEKWHRPGYLQDLLNVPNRTYLLHESRSFRFMYWKKSEDGVYPEGWVAPSTTRRCTYAEYLDLIQKDRGVRMHNETHYYLFAEGYWSTQDPDFRWPPFVDLPMFMPHKKNDMFLSISRYATYQKLHCKFGTKGNMAMMHFDQGRNMIVLLSGQRRFLLAPTKECSKLHIFPKDHPSARNSRFQFSNHTEMRGIAMNELVTRPGDAVYIPSYWFHSIISLTDNMAQCATWSIPTDTRTHIIQQCGNLLSFQ